MSEFLLEFAKLIRIQFARGVIKDASAVDEAYLNKVCEQSVLCCVMYGLTPRLFRWSGRRQTCLNAWSIC
jgi:hypothetical protein